MIMKSYLECHRVRREHREWKIPSSNAESIARLSDRIKDSRIRGFKRNTRILDPWNPRILLSCVIHRALALCPALLPSLRWTSARFSIYHCILLRSVTSESSVARQLPGAPLSLSRHQEKAGPDICPELVRDRHHAPTGRETRSATEDTENTENGKYRVGTRNQLPG